MESNPNGESLRYVERKSLDVESVSSYMGSSVDS